ncbi:MAG: hypothetical protein SOU32_03180 [Lachnospiraceae bacterium]|nr:hypothetical protein [Lachnospiraceae bacterium]
MDGLGIFRVAFLFVCQIAALVFTSGPAGQVPFFAHLLGRRNSDIISSLGFYVNSFLILFFVPALTDSLEVMSAAALLSGEADYNISFFHLQQQISRILKL